MTDFNKYGIFPHTDGGNTPNTTPDIWSMLPSILNALGGILGTNAPSTPASTTPPIDHSDDTTPHYNAVDNDTESVSPHATPIYSPSLDACRTYMRRHDDFVSKIK